MHLQIAACHLVEPPVRQPQSRRKADKASDGADTDHDSSDAFADLTDDETHVDALVSSDDGSNSEASAEIGNDGAGDIADAEGSGQDDDTDGFSESGTHCRAPKHTHTAWQNKYFVLTDNRKYPGLQYSSERESAG